MARRIETIDYLRLMELGRRSLTLDIPSALVPKKRRSRVSGKRARESERRFGEAAAQHFRLEGRRAFRAEVAAHIILHGVELDRSHRVVKALLDGLKGAAFADDRAVGLLDISSIPADGSRPSAEIHLCPLRLYTDAFDIFSGAHDDHDEGDDDFEPILPHDREHPWRSNAASPSRDLEIDTVRDNLGAMSEADYLSEELREDLIRYDEERIRRYELDVILDHPYRPDERPGALNIMGQLWRQFDLRTAWAIQIAGPTGGVGSWTETAAAAIEQHFAARPRLAAALQPELVAVDVAVCEESARFDLDGLVDRVLRGWRHALSDGPMPESIRAYRRVTDGGRVEIRMRSPERAKGLRRVFTSPYPAAFEYAPDPDARVHRARPELDATMAERIRELDEEMRRNLG